VSLATFDSKIAKVQEGTMGDLYFGDNLAVLRKYVKDDSVDLIYLDPPFNSSANYNVLFREGDGVPSEAQAEAFKDTWSWGPAAAEAYEDALRMGSDLSIIMRALRAWLGDNGLMAYLAMMTVRLVELHRVLKETGSLYLHCDPTASHYLKMILDAVFGADNFINEIVWRRYSRPKGSQFAARKYGSATDSILFYSRSSDYFFDIDKVRRRLSERELEEMYPLRDEKGRYMSGPMLRSASMGPRPNLVFEYGGFTPGPAGWRMVKQKVAALDAQGDIYWTSSGQPRRKVRPGAEHGAIVDSLWTDIEAIGSQAEERLGYPTQKPVALLERIIKASSREGDVVLDPFCGCGTTIDAAEGLHRQWLGIDITHYAVTLIETRLRKAHENAAFKIIGRPTDMAGARKLAERDKYQFQWWAAWKLGAQTYETKKGADRGIDANIFYPNGPYGHGRIIVSVKGGEHVTPAMVSELSGVVQRESAEMGVLITLNEPTRAMIANAAGAGFVEKSAHGRLPRIQILTVQDLLDGRFPKLPPLPVPQDSPRARAPRRRDRDQLELMLPFVGSGGLRTEDGNMIDPRFLEIAHA
jgi:site-specific DNA-methyltransferase (adenine-specific)